MPLLVADTGPLIAFECLGLLALLPVLYGPVFIPPAVERELDLDGGRPDSPSFRNALLEGVLSVRSPASSLEATLGEDFGLHAGERQALALALEVEDGLLFMDERRGRLVAQALGLAMVGTLGALVKGKHGGHIERLSPLILMLEKRGYRLSPDLVARALSLAGEA